MQIAHQLTRSMWGWPVAWGISLISALAGAAACCGLWELGRERYRNPMLPFLLVMASGFQILFYGHIEVYAVPTCALVFLIIVLRKIECGQWPPSSLLLIWSILLWCHLVALVLIPVLVFAAFQYKSSLFKGKIGFAGLILPPVLFVLTDILQIGHGPGLKDLVASFFERHERMEAGLSFRDLVFMKVGFFWMATQISFPFAALALFRKPGDRFTQYMAILALCTLVFFVFFHPDAGKMDWDLFLLPSLPLAILGAEAVLQSRYRMVFIAGWIAAFLSVWIPRVPIWADLPNRSLGNVTLVDIPQGVNVRLDERYEIPGTSFRAPGGFHSLAVLFPGQRTRWKVFALKPGERLALNLPQTTAPVSRPHAECPAEVFSPSTPPGESLR